jgi:vacuolar-type H+-ATPase subunit H
MHRRATLRSLERQIEDRILRTDESAEQIIAQAEGEVRETVAIPPWHIERRAKEFMELLQKSGSMKADKLRTSVRSFVQNYAGDSLSRGSFRAISNELDAYMQSPRSSRWTS